jgi:hypothetical protein
MAEYLETPREWRWHRRFIWPASVAALLCIPVVIWKIEWLAWAVWCTFLVEDVVMLAVVRRKGAWLRVHWFETAVLVLTFPLWHDLAPDLFALELVGALRLVELLNVLKLLKAGRILHRHARERGATRRASRARSG